MAGMAGMAVRRNELQNAESRKSNGGNGRIEGMGDRMVKWQTEMATYTLFMVHTDGNDDDNDDDDDDDDDDNDTLIFYIIDPGLCIMCLAPSDDLKSDYVK